MAAFNLQIVTPDRLFFDGEVDAVIVRTTEGDVAVFKDHINYVAALDIGHAKIKNGENYREAIISGGFIQVGEDKTTIVTEAAEWPEEIDLERARRAKEHAEALIGRKLENISSTSVEAKLKRAVARISAAEKHHLR